MNQKRHKITLEMLSAYLDSQLSEKDRSKVESALQVDPTLKQELSMLDATRRLLRNTPTLKVPRNFTLSPSMVSKQNPFKFWMPAMSFSSALAAILFVLSFFFNFSPVGTALTAQTRNMDQFVASDAIAPERLEMADESAKNMAEEPPMIIQWFGQQANGMGGGGPAAEVAEGGIMPEEAAPLVAEAPAYEEESSEMYTMDTAAGAAAESAMGEMPAEEPLPILEEEAAPTAKEAPATETDGEHDYSDDASPNIILGVSPEEDRGQIIDEAQHVMPQTLAEEAQPATRNTTLLAILRGSLLLLSITFAVIAYLMYRRRA